MKRYASVRFGDALDRQERESATRALRSAGATATSWKTTAARTYAGLEVDREADFKRLGDRLAGERLDERLPNARLDVPPLGVLRVRPVHAHLLARLSDALGGAGRPSGIIELVSDGDAVVVEFQPQRTPLHLVIALIDGELATAPGRTIEPLVPFDDATLAAFAGGMLAIADLDASRIVETHTEALLARTAL